MLFFIHDEYGHVAVNSQFRHVSLSEISDQSDRCWWNHHCNDAILSHTLTLVAYVRRSELLSLKLFGESKCPGYMYLKILWNYFRTHCIGEMMHKSVSAGGITPRLPFHYLRQENYNILLIFLVKELDEEYIDTNCRSKVITFYIYTNFI